MASVLVTGANRGIGLELARQLNQRGDDVVAVCRKSSDELAKLGVEVLDGVDVTDDDSVAGLARRLDGRRLDILVNNAGILLGESLTDLDFDTFRRQYEVNALGPLRVTLALAPLIPEGGKVGIVSSRVGSLADNGSGGNYGYRMSKAAVNMAGVNLAHELKPRGITVILLHPGYVRTGMTSGNGFIDAPEAASGLIARIDEADLSRTGTFWHADGQELPW